MDYANTVWSNGTDLRNNLDSMITYRGNVLERKQKLDKDILSNHNGLNYDIKTIINPRGHAVGSQPSIGLVQKSMTLFS
jgi:hypothetical protein